MTPYVTCSVSRPACGVFLHHDGHAAGRGSADLKRANQTGGGGGGRSTGSTVGLTEKHMHKRRITEYIPASASSYLVPSLYRQQLPVHANWQSQPAGGDPQAAAA